LLTFEPMTLPRERVFALSRLPNILRENSGTDVPKPMTMTPTRNGEMPHASAMLAEESTNNLAPK